MQRFLALALAAGGLLAYTSPAVAQVSDQPAPRVGADSGRRTFDPIGRLLAKRDELKITDEQAARLEAIRTKYAERNQGRIEELRRDRETRRALRASMDSARTEVMAVLTPEQQRQVEDMRHDRKHRRRHHH